MADTSSSPDNIIPESAGRNIETQGDYFEHIEGNAQVFSGFVYMQRYLERTKGDIALDPSICRTNYLTRLLSTTSRLHLGGIDRKAADHEAETCLNLSEVYTALLTLSTEGDLRGMHQEEREQERRRSALDLLNHNDRLVLLGGPGSGKSTFVKFVSMCLAGELLGDGSANIARLIAPLPDDKGQDTEACQPWEHGALLPVQVILRDFAAKGLPLEGQPATARHLWEFIVQSLNETMLGDYTPHLARHLWEEGGLVLLDGLDEVPEAGKRRVQIKQAVEDFAMVFPKCRIVVTSRTYAYQQQDWRLQHFTETVLAPFTQGQIRRFVDRWYRHSAIVRGKNLDDAQGRAEQLKRAILTNEHLHDFAKRPLLLTLMASLHAWRGGSLPEKRGDLYGEATDLLLDWWERDKVVRDAEGKMMVSQPSLTEMLRVGKERVQEVLNRLAFDAHASQPDSVGTADILEENLIMALMRICRNENVNPVLLVKHVSDRAGLLIPRGVEVYTFPHRTFQEYLAARHLFLQDDYPDNMAELARQDSNRWREVVLLAAALGPPRDVWALVEALCQSELNKSQYPEADAWGALLAGQAMTETLDLEQIASRHQAKIERLQDWLIAILTEQPFDSAQDRPAPFPAVERALAGNILAQLGDPRPGVGLCEDGLPDIVWCDVPAGEFLMGSTPETVNREKPKWEKVFEKHNLGDKTKDLIMKSLASEQPQHEILLTAYQISRYPVTNAQYRAFIDDGGYSTKHRRCWTPEGWQWKEQEQISVPETYGGTFDEVNHPVVGVSWYEAVAFCNWLTCCLREHGETQAIRLPTEAEWEKAARSDDGRIYPWGDEKITPEHGNYYDTQLGTTSTVGCFPRRASPYGCEDMIGNVWEWCQDWFDYDYYENSSVQNPSGPASGSYRIFRGGGWGNVAENCRAEFRDWFSPGACDGRVGFRLVRTPALQQI